jgi:NAD(P)-dependent dehydrogenase (short-subunit alcohol dehydrogenase family)
VLTLAGRGAIVAGTKRIGRIVVERLVSEGVIPAIVYRSSRADAEELRDSVRGRAPAASVIQADLTVEADVVRTVETARRELGDLSICVNLASDFPRVPLADLDANSWEQGMAAAKGAYLLALHAGRNMMTNPGPTRGHLVFFGDWAAEATPYPDYLPYLTAKAAVHFMTRAFAVEFAPHGILVNTISPGPTMRPDEIAGSEWQANLQRTPLRRESSAAEMAEIIATLLKLETVTGENIRVDSGKHLTGPAGT